MSCLVFVRLVNSLTMFFYFFLLFFGKSLWVCKLFTTFASTTYDF